MDKAVFLDRDGVINELVQNEITKENEPPFEIGEIKLINGAVESLKKLYENNFKLFIVSNQPDHAKGKTSIENLKRVHNELDRIFKEEGIIFTEYYYCYHHPEGIIKEYTKDCECRKPGTYFVRKAIEEYNIDIKLSWFAGDRDTDIKCGKTAGLKTILIDYKKSENYRKGEVADYTAVNLEDAVKKILESEKINS